MRMCLLTVLISILIATGHAEPFDALNAPIRWTQEPIDSAQSLDNLHYKVLWIVCTADSACLPQDWPFYNSPGDTLPDSLRHWRVANPSTFAMPSWAGMMFDSSSPYSLTRYYLDQSGNYFLLTGKVQGHDENTVFKCDTNVSVRPDHSSQAGGADFFNNIMPKVDSVVNFADYLMFPTSNSVPFLIFDIYGLSEFRDGECHTEAGGRWPLPANYLSIDTNVLGQRINIPSASGVVFWSTSEQAMSSHGPCGGPPDSAMAAYWMSLGHAAHEFGHLIGFPHTFCDQCSGGDQWAMFPWSHLGFGSLDVLGYSIGFPDPDNGWSWGPTTPYNPGQRFRVGWLTPVLVNSPLMNYVLNDHLYFPTDVCLKIPTYRTDGSANQFFIVTAVTRGTLWDRHFPADGVMITHDNPSGHQDTSSHKKYDPELSTGLYDWTVRHELENPSWGCDTCHLWTGENTLARNTSTGRDSFDFVYVHNPEADWPICTYYGLHDELGVSASPGNFFAPGQVFCDTSNPSAAAQSNVSPFAQNLPSMADVSVLSIDHYGHTITVNAWSRHWSGNITTNALWMDSVVVDADVTFADGAVLTIKPGTVIKVAANALIWIYTDAQMVAEGTAQSPISFSGLNGGLWDGIWLWGSGHSLSHCNIVNAVTAVTAWNGNTALNHCNISNCQNGVMETAGITMQMDTCVLDVTGRYGVFSQGYLRMNHCTVESATRTGIFLAGGLGMANITRCSIFGNGPQAQTELYRGGIVNTYSGLVLTENSIGGNYGPGLSCLGGSADLSGGRIERPIAVNCIMDNFAVGGTRAQIQRNGGGLSIRNGRNLVCAEDGWLIHDNDPNAALDVTVNNWCGRQGDVADSALPANYISVPLDEVETCPALELEPIMADTPTQAELLYQQAFDAEMNMSYELAISKYSDVMKEYSESEQAKLCPDRILSCEAFSSKDYVDRRYYFLAIADTTSDAQFEFELRSSAAWCLVMMKEFDDAHDEFEALLDKAADDYDYQKGSLSELMAEIVESPLNFTEGKRSSSRTERVNSILDRMDEALTRKPSGRSASVVPREYALYQNYPNPFNPTTEIRFDLPKAARVELKIFNSLGQQVATLLDENRVAGSHSVKWDGSGVASGVYIYQLKSGSYTDSKKMVLMK
jgi:hypothetical protein